MIADERRGGSSREGDAAGRRGGNDESANQLGSRPSSRTVIQALTRSYGTGASRFRRPV